MRRGRLGPSVDVIPPTPPQAVHARRFSGHIGHALRASVLAAVKRAQRFQGAAIPGVPPVLCIDAPPSTRQSDLLASDVLVVPWGWDLAFGGVLTIAAATRAVGYLGRVVVRPTDEVFSQLEGGHALLAITAAGKVVSILEANLGSFSAGYREQWQRVRDHVPLFDDPRAAPWDALHHQRVVVQNMLRPEDRLSLGWVARYRRAVTMLSRVLAEAPPGIIARARAELAQQQGEFARRMLGAIVESEMSLPALVRWVTGLRAQDERDFVRFVVAATEIHDVLHALTGEHAPFCTLHAHLLEVELLAPHSTADGNALAWLSKETQRFELLRLAPAEFPRQVDPEAYWARINPPVLWNWGAVVSGSDVHADLTVGSALWAQLPRAEDIEASEEAADGLLSEAIANKRWTIPPGAEIELQLGPFSRVTAWELGNEVCFVLRASTAEFAIVSIEPGVSFIGFSGEDGISPEEAASVYAALKLVLSAVVRDFFVVEERSKIFGYRLGRKPKRRPDAQEVGPRVIYLPRVRYTGHAAIDRCRDELALANRRRHEVGAHLRKVHQASEHQIWLARTYGFSVPQGFTFVRPHKRGQRSPDVVYRSRSALATLFEVVDTLPGEQGGVAPWFRFERDVARLLASLGFAVEHVAAARKGDGGVDVYATKGNDLDTVCWVIQCKRYAPSRVVGPSVVRELIGALAEYPAGTRGMIVTTSTYSAEARSSAERANIRLMDGPEFSERIRSATQ